MLKICSCIFFIFLLCLSNCANSGVFGKIEIYKKKLTPFTHLVVDGPFFVSGCSKKEKGYGVEINAEKEVIELISIKVNNGSLHLALLKDRALKKRRIRVRLSCDELYSISLNKYASFLENGISQDIMSVKISHHSEVTLRGKVKHFDAEIDGGSLLSSAHFYAQSMKVIMTSGSRAYIRPLTNISSTMDPESKIIIFANKSEILFSTSNRRKDLEYRKPSSNYSLMDNRFFLNFEKIDHYNDYISGIR